jgi:hypothetical protein
MGVGCLEVWRLREGGWGWVLGGKDALASWVYIYVYHVFMYLVEEDGE